MLGTIKNLLPLLLIGLFLIPLAFGQYTENVVNGSFESGVANWEIDSSGETTSEAGKTGVSSLCDSLNDSMIGNQVHQAFAAVIPSETAGYLSFWLKSTGDILVNVYLIYETEGYVQYYLADPSSYADWTLVNSSLHDNYPGDSISGIQIYISGLGSADAFVDDVSITFETGTSTPPPDTWGALITNFSQFVIPLTVIMIPVLLLVTITRSTDKWVILIGLTIGAALGYFFGMVPLWAMFLVTIGLIGMAYQSVRGGG